MPFAEGKNGQAECKKTAAIFKQQNNDSKL